MREPIESVTERGRDPFGCDEPSRSQQRGVRGAASQAPRTEKDLAPTGYQATVPALPLSLARHPVPGRGSDAVTEGTGDIDAVILYMITLPVAQARAQLSKLVDEAASTHERFEITRNGQRAAVLLGADDYDALQETIAVLGDSQLLDDHFEAMSALEQGDSLDQNELAEMMRRAGHLPARR